MASDEHGNITLAEDVFLQILPAHGKSVRPSEKVHYDHWHENISNVLSPDALWSVRNQKHRK
jgi:hypothetical protein